MRNIFLDTNSYSRYFQGDKSIKKVISKSEEVLISVITLGELYLGFKEGNKEAENLRVLKEFVGDPKVKIVNINEKVSWGYGRIKYELRKRGTPIPENDIWIAAHVIETDSELISYDDHFLNIKGLKVWEKLSGKN